MNANLTREYYVGHDGVYDDFVAQLNCFQAALHFVLKFKTGINQPYELFMQDPSCRLLVDAEGRFRDLRLAGGWQCREVFQTHDVKGQGATAMAELESILDEGEIVLFETFLNRVPYMKDFISFHYPYDPARHNTPHNHIFVALAHTDTHLYYVEAPMLLTDKHVPYNNSPCVGMIEKSVLRNATDCFLNYRRVEIKNEGLHPNLMRTRLMTELRLMLDNVARPMQESAEGKMFYGAEALEKVVECCRSGALLMNRPSSLYEFSEGAVLQWKVSSIRQKKTMLYRCIQRNEELFGQHAGELLRALQASVEAWQVANSKLGLMLLKKQEDTTAVQRLMIRIKDCDLRFVELAMKWYACAEVREKIV